MNGCLLLDVALEHVSLKSMNIVVEVKPRTVVVKGAGSYKIYTTPSEQYVYISLVDGVKPFADRLGNECRLESFSIRVESVKTSIGWFLLIELSKQFNIDYLIISEERICVAVPKRYRLTVELMENTGVLYVY